MGNVMGYLYSFIAPTTTNTEEPLEPATSGEERKCK